MPDDHGQLAAAESAASDADGSDLFDRWLREFDVKQAALTARQDAFLRELRRSARQSAHDPKNA